jgi:hypothetical protein
MTHTPFKLRVAARRRVRSGQYAHRPIASMLDRARDFLTRP